MPASCAPGPSVEGMIWDVMASSSAAVTASRVWNGGGVEDSTASCACCCAEAISANAATPTHCDSQSRRVDCMIYLARLVYRFASETHFWILTSFLLRLFDHSVQAACQVQIRPVEFGSEHLRDIVLRFLGAIHFANAR